MFIYLGLHICVGCWRLATTALARESGSTCETPMVVPLLCYISRFAYMCFECW
jgi:hypothetical protein